MRKKIEISTDEAPLGGASPDLSSDGIHTEIEDHAMPQQPVPDMATDASEPIGASNEDASTQEFVSDGSATTQELSPDGPASTQELSPDKSAKTQELDQLDYVTAIQDDLEDTRLRLADAEARAGEMRKVAEEAGKKLIYLQAEFQNYRRRRDEERGTDMKVANAELIKLLLPIIDNFERALAAAERTSNFEALVGGVSGTLKQLQAFLGKAGVKKIEALGQEFDPNFHEAIGSTESEEYPANTVAEEVQPGYVMHDKVLRPSLVKVTQS
jgi:molecular chaperone GrpE